MTGPEEQGRREPGAPHEPHASRDPDDTAAESARPADPTGPGGPARPDGSADPVEPAEPVASAERVEPAGTVEHVESTEPVDTVESAEPVETAEPVASAERVEPAGTVEHVESTEPVDTVESTEPAEPAEPTEPAESAEPVGVTAPEPVEPAAATEGTPSGHTAAHEQQPNRPHAGNGTVNHGPDEQGPDGLDSDELALRRLLHGAVQDIAPRDGTLEHLRRAVPARRARKRQAVVGMAAAALFAGTAVPALVHVSGATGGDANPSIAGHGSQAQGGTSQGKNTEGTGDKPGGPSGTAEEKDKDTEEKPDKGEGGGTDHGSGDSADPSAPSSESAGPCTADQLGAAGWADAPDSMGTVYGTFRITNVSGGSCAVSGPGSLVPLAQGAADPAKIGQAPHVAGDPAAGLPDPSLEVPQLVLLPGAAYEVRFAWVPSETCPTDSGPPPTTGGESGGPSPDPTPTETPSTSTEGTSTGGDTGTTTQLMAEDGTVDGSVAVSYTAEAGTGAGVTVPNACAGTVYRTGLLPAS
ncbi:hypothetical protein AB0L04_18790 [Streptomyces glaucescens]|uniref:hypothetical protein n=1 Tax=Streptomyces glaucescens TaxID=1907 RepID=UPI00344EC811